MQLQPKAWRQRSVKRGGSGTATRRGIADWRSMVRRERLVAAGVGLTAPVISFSLFVVAVLNKFPPLPYEVILFTFWSLQPVLLLSAPVAAVVAMLLRRHDREGGWRLLAVRFAMPVVSLLLWLIAGFWVLVLAGSAAG